MNKRKLGWLGMTVASVVMAVTLTGCEEGTLIYQGVERPVSEVEEIISDTLEVENPSLDLNVSISEEVDD